MIKKIFFKLFDIVDYEFTNYEKEVFEYFKEIALKVEFGESPNRVLKWLKPMKIYIKKEKEFKPQLKKIQETIDKLNDLVSDGFKIEITNNLQKSNTILYLLKKSKVKEIDPYFFKGINEDFSGMVNLEYDLDYYYITSAKIFIDISESLYSQKSTIVEELTHSIGLMNDSEKYSKSTFYQLKYKSNIEYDQYTDLDKELIKLLYLPSMKPGLKVKQVEKVIKKYYQSIKI